MLEPQPSPNELIKLSMVMKKNKVVTVKNHDIIDSPRIWDRALCPVQDLLLDLERLSGDLRALATPLTKRFVLIPPGVEPAAVDAPEALEALG